MRFNCVGCSLAKNKEGRYLRFYVIRGDYIKTPHDHYNIRSIMTLQQKASCVFITVSLILMAVDPESPWISFAVVASIFLFGFVLWVERKKIDSVKHLEDEIKKIKDKVDGIIIGKGFGR